MTGCCSILSIHRPQGALLPNASRCTSLPRWRPTGAFLDAVRAIGVEGGGVGLASLDKARDAINMVKVLGALNSAADRLKKVGG